MKLLGSLTDYIKSVFRKDNRDITLRPGNTVTYQADRNIDLPDDESATGSDPGDQILVGKTAEQTLSNKTLDATNSVDVGTLPTQTAVRAAGSATDTDIPTEKAVRDALDLQNDASEIDYDNALSGLVAGDVKAALDELDGDVASVESDVASKAEETVDLIAGDGLTGGGDLTAASLAFNIGAADSTIVVNPDNIQVGEIADANVSTDANIDAAKLGTGTVDNTEFGHLDGVTSGIQGQLDDKASLISNNDFADNTLSSFFVDDLKLLGPSGQVVTNAYDLPNSSTLLQFSDTADNLQTISMNSSDPTVGHFLLIANTSPEVLTIENETGTNTNQQFSFSDNQNFEIQPENTAFFVYRFNKWRLAGGSGSGSGTALETTIVSANTNMAGGITYAVDTSAGSYTLTLPDLSAETEDQVIWVSDLDENAATNNIAISPASGESIGDQAAGEDFIIDLDGGWAKLSGNAGDSQWSLETPGVLGPDLLGEDNTWTGTNEFTEDITIEQATESRLTLKNTDTDVDLHQSIGALEFRSLDGSGDGDHSVGIKAQAGITAGNLFDLRFYTKNNTFGAETDPSMVIDHLGSVGIGTEPDSNKILHTDGGDVLFENDGGGEHDILFKNTGAGPSDYVALLLQGDGGDASIIKSSTTNGSYGGGDTLSIQNGSGGVHLHPGDTAWSATSDMRYKTKVKDIDRDLLPSIGTLDIFTYQANESIEAGKAPIELGLSAQQVKEVVPEIVSGSEETKLGIKYDRVGVVALKLIQELSADNDAKQTVIDDLLLRVVALETQINGGS